MESGCLRNFSAVLCALLPSCMASETIATGQCRLGDIGEGKCPPGETCVEESDGHRVCKRLCIQTCDCRDGEMCKDGICTVFEGARCEHSVD